ncbi:MAG: pitrilysin family protein [Candidatus Andersenbacteria bacterium]
MKNFPLTEKKLPGGLRTVLLPRQEGQTVTFLVLIGVGSRYETPRQSGLSHFLEHMFFKGTQRRPTTKEIAEAIENVGGEFNAFTSEEYTGYYVKVAAEYLEQGAEVVSDILLRPLFPQVEIDRERGVITEEIRMYTDTPMRHIWHLWQEALFGAHPLGRRIDGTLETVGTFMRKDFLQYTQRHYHTENAVVAVAGKFAEKQTEQLLKELLAPLARGKETSPKTVPKRLPQRRFLNEYRKSLDQTHMIVGVPGLSLTDPRRWAAELLATILGAGMSSRLFIQVRERHGLAYAVRTSTESYTDAGAVATQAGVRTDKADFALRLILQEYDRIMQEKVTADELAKAKQMLRGRMVIDLEETNTLALFAGLQELLTQRIDTPTTMWEKIEAVTPEQIQTVAQALLAPTQRVAVLLGPQKSTKEFSKQLGL